LAERGEGEAVLDLEPAELERLEEFGDLGAAVEHTKGGSGDGVLLGCEVRDLKLLDHHEDDVRVCTYALCSLIPQLILLGNLVAVFILGDILRNSMVSMRLLGIAFSTHCGG
jgi:hypothetical protein